MSQPACTAIQLALTDLLRSWGVRPNAVTGHSSGEIAAAYAAGILSLEECVRVAYARGVAAALLSADPQNGKGSMMAVGANSTEVQSLLDTLCGHHAVIACVNSESSVTVSGDDEAIIRLQKVLDKKGVFARKLQVDVAYHSHHMQRVAKQYRSFIGRIVPRTSSIPFHSTVHGKHILPSALNASYWVSNLVSRVEFVEGVRSLLGHRVAIGQTSKAINTLVEIGPHCALQTPIKQIVGHHFPSTKVHYLPSLKRKVDAVHAIHQLAMALWTHGLQLDFGAVNFPGVEIGEERKPTVLTNLPQYPWNHSEFYWHKTRLSDNLYQRPFARNDILGSLSMENVDLEPRWRNVLRVDDHPWIRQHRVHEGSVYPLAGFMAMAAEAVGQQAALQNLVLDRIEMREVSVGRALAIPESSSVETILSMRPCNHSTGNSVNVWHEFHILSWAESRGWEENCRGFVLGLEKKVLNPVDGHRQQAAKMAATAQKVADMRAACTAPVDSHTLYEHVARCGVNYGPLFRGLFDITTGNNHEASANLIVPDTKACMPRQEESKCIVHPVWLDLCIQLVWVLLGYDQPGLTVTHLPSFMKHISLSASQTLQPGDQLHVYGNPINAISTRSPLSHSIVASLPSDPSNPIVHIDGMVTTSISSDDGGVSAAKPLCYREQFEPCFDFLPEADLDILTGPDRGDGPGAQRTQLLDEVSSVYLRRAVESLKESEVLSFKPHHQRLFRWAQEISRTVTSDKSYCRLHGQEEELIRHVQSMNAVGEMTCKLGEQLIPMLRGYVDPLAVMLEDDLLGRHYEDNDHLRQAYGRATKCIDKMAHQNPHLTFLEIGAGTGGATLPILRTLGGESGTTPRFGHFTYTDISIGFFENAKTRFRSWQHLMSYKTLDISSDPVAQGYEPHSYDVVIACNVLHATPRIRETLANVRRLMKPGGKLLLIEETRLKSSHFMYSLLPGWWLSEDPDRINGPILSQSQWQGVLTENEFSGVDIGIDDYPGMPQRSSTVMVSTASSIRRDQVPGDVVIVHMGSANFSLGHAVTKELRSLTGRPVTTGDLTTDLKGKLCIVLDNPDRPVLSNLTPQRFQAVQALLARANGILWVVRKGDTGPESLGTHLAVGLARSVRSETSLPFSTLDVGLKGELTEKQVVQQIQHVFIGVFCSPSVLQNGDMDFVVQEGRTCVSRVVEDPDLNQSLLQDTDHAPPQFQQFLQPSRPLKMVPGEGGALSDCYFTDIDAAHLPLPDDHVEMRVACVGLNFRDVLVVMGQIQGGFLGQECSGIITSVGAAVEDFRVGDRVCCVTPGSMASHVRSPVANIWRVPNTMELEVAASIPVVFTTAYYSLFDMGHLTSGESILIHAAAGGVGQAAIMLAQEVGAKIFATVSSPEKKQLLMDIYELPEEQIFFSRDTSFADGVHKATGGQGVDVVLNSLTGDSLRATFECLAPFGRFVELGKRDIVQNARLEMAHFDNNVSFSSVDLSLVIRKRPALMQRLLRDVFIEFQKPLIRARWSISGYSISEIEGAFRALQSGKTIGKAVVRMEDEAMVKVCLRLPASSEKEYFQPDSYWGYRSIQRDNLATFSLPMPHTLSSVAREGLGSRSPGGCLKKAHGT